MQKTKSMVLNETGKAVVHVTDNQSWNSCGKVASDHEFTFGSAREPTKKKFKHIDHALYMATYFSQNMVPLWSGCTGHHVHFFVLN